MNISIETLADRLREERRRLKLNQAALAEAGGVSRVTQVGYEAGTSAPSIAYLARITAVGVDGDYILYGARKAARITEEFDWTLHAEILETVAEWADAEDVRIPPKKFAGVIRRLYEEFSSAGTVESAKLARTLQLVA